MLNYRDESMSEYKYRLQAFAIAYRLSRVSNFIHVADQIVQKDLIYQFNQFQPPKDLYKNNP